MKPGRAQQSTEQLVILPYLRSVKSISLTSNPISLKLISVSILQSTPVYSKCHFPLSLSDKSIVISSMSDVVNTQRKTKFTQRSP
jgi:hypothetical protein